MKHEQPAVATPSQTVGPFFHLSLKALPNGGMAPASSGERIRLRIVVSDADGRPVDDALVELWHARTAAGDTFGRMPTDKDGACEFETARPQRRTDSGHLQAAHINICLFARGLLRQVHTRIYFDGDSDLADDAVLALVPRDRRGTLLARPDPQDARRWLFHVRLQGAQETVFFDP